MLDLVVELQVLPSSSFRGISSSELNDSLENSIIIELRFLFLRQTWITAPLTLGAVGLAYYGTTLKASTTKSGHQVCRSSLLFFLLSVRSKLTDLSLKTLGFTFAALLLLQVFLGWWTHESHEPLKPGEPPPPRALKAWLHIIIGISLIGLGVRQSFPLYSTCELNVLTNVEWISLFKFD